MGRFLRPFPLIVLFGAVLSAQPTVQLYKRINPSVVLIETEKGGGSGFCIEGRLIATSLHVVDGSTNVSISFRSGITSNTVELVAVDSSVDLALLRVPESACNPLALGDSSNLQPGQRIYVVGNPLARRDLSGSITDGLVSGVRTLEGKRKVIQISAPLSPGNSGGPVISESGEVVGIVAFKLTSGELLNFAVPANDLKNLVAAKSATSLHSWTTKSGPPYRSSAYQLGSDALAVFRKAEEAMGTCDLEDAEWEEMIATSMGRSYEQKRFEKREFGSIRVFSAKTGNGQPAVWKMRCCQGQSESFPPGRRKRGPLLPFVARCSCAFGGGWSGALRRPLGRSV